MAYPNDWYETLVAAASMATQALSLPNTFIEAVYTEYSPNYQGALGQTLTINVPTVSVSNASDEGNGGITGISPGDVSVQVSINHKYGSNRKVTLYEDTLAAQVLSQVYVQPVIEEVLRKLDQAMCADITSANFNSYTSITAGADTIARSHLGQAWANLRAAGAPLNDPSNNYLLSHPVVIGNMMSSSDFSSESTVGIRAAELAQQRALVVNQFNFRVLDDPYCPLPGAGTYAALAAHRYCYGLRTVTPSLVRNENLVQTVVFPKPKVPVVLETWYEPKDQARYIHAYVMCGHKVVRPELGQFLVTT